MPESRIKNRLPHKEVSVEKADRNSGEPTSDSDETEIERWKEVNSIQKEVFEAICSESRSQLKRVLYCHNPSLILQVLVTFTYPNHDALFHHDHEILKDAAELLGPSVQNLNAIQSSCMLGEEEIAIEIINYVAQQSEIMSTKKVLYEFMSKVWGSGNTILHLASFMGMSNLVQRLIDLGANTNKRNERNYKAVDCADDDKTRALFLNLKEVIRYPIRRSMSVDGNSPRTKAPTSIDPVFTKQKEKNSSLQRSKAINKKSTEHVSRRSSQIHLKLPALKEESIEPTEESVIQTPVCLNRAKTLGTSGISISKATLERSRVPRSLNSSMESSVSEPTDRKVSFDPKTLALDYARLGDYIELKRILESTNKKILLDEGEKTVFDISTRHLHLTLLHLASSYNHLSICQYLIENGAFVNSRDREGWTPIHCAAAEGHDSIVRFLLSVPDLSLNALNSDDESPCDVAANEHIRGMLKEKLVRRISLDFNKTSPISLDESLCDLQRATLIVSSTKGGDSGLLRPSRSLSHRITAPSKPFSPPHSFSKPLVESLSSSPPSTPNSPKNSNSSTFNPAENASRLSYLASF